MKMLDWIADHPRWFFGFLVAFIVLLIVGAAEAESSWVKQCMEAENLPEYRCRERWDIAHPPAPVVYRTGGYRP